MIIAAIVRTLLGLGLPDATSRKVAPWIAGAGALMALGLLAWLLVSIADRWHENAIEIATKAGAQEQREGDLRETIKRAETANEVRETISNEMRAGGGDDAYAQCLRTARTPANCERWLPRVQADQR